MTFAYDEKRRRGGVSIPNGRNIILARVLRRRLSWVLNLIVGKLATFFLSSIHFNAFLVMWMCQALHAHMVTVVVVAVTIFGDLSGRVGSLTVTPEHLVNELQAYTVCLCLFA